MSSANFSKPIKTPQHLVLKGKFEFSTSCRKRYYYYQFLNKKFNITRTTLLLEQAPFPKIWDLRLPIATDTTRHKLTNTCPRQAISRANTTVKIARFIAGNIRLVG